MLSSVWTLLAVTLTGTSLLRGTCGYQKYNNYGHPLFLSPLLRAGKWQLAQQQARVLHSELSGVESYSGFLTINETCNANTFFWFFRAARQPRSAPLLVWLQGGPGVSSLYGLFNEVGPWKLRMNRAVRREFPWTDEHHMVFLDNPVGTGFSFTESESCYARDEGQIGEDLYRAVAQLFVMFPDLADREVFLTGESYAGKYIPALGRAVAKHNPTATTKINVKGLMMGNAFTDPISSLGLSDLLYQLGLVDFKVKVQAQQIEDFIAQLIHREEYVQATKNFNLLLGLVVQGTVGFDVPYNFLHSSDYVGDPEMPYVMRADIRRAIHVGDKEFHNRTLVYKYMEGDFMKSYGDWIPELLDSYRVLYYNGQLDLLVAYTYVENFLRNLPWDGQKEYNLTPRQKWYVKGQLAGYVTNHGPLSQVLVRNAGHMVPYDQPGWAYDMLRKFVTNKPLAPRLPALGQVLPPVGNVGGVGGVGSEVSVVNVGNTGVVGGSGGLGSEVSVVNVGNSPNTAVVGGSGASNRDVSLVNVGISEEVGGNVVNTGGGDSL